MEPMLRGTGRRIALKTALLAVVLAMPRARAAGSDYANMKSIEGMQVFLGVMPSELLSQGAADVHGVPTGRGYHHVVVAVFDEKTGKRLTDLEIAARVESIGRTVVEEKPLQAMLTNRVVSFGNFFAMPGGDDYRIHLNIRRHHRTSNVTFNYRHA